MENNFELFSRERGRKEQKEWGALDKAERKHKLRERERHKGRAGR